MATRQGAESKLTKSQKSTSFRNLTNFIVVQFGLEPQWQIHITLKTDTSEFKPGVVASTDWHANYRDAYIETVVDVLDEPNTWVKILIHELTHLQLSETHNHMESVAGENMARVHAVCESTVSEVANVTEVFFRKAYEKELKEWLT